MTAFDLPDVVGALPWPWAAGLGGLLGLVIGSYLATVFVRWPQGRSANDGRSRCDGCGRQLQWFELVPLASWLAIGGRCRTCGQSIDPAHVGIELLCGITGAAAFAVDLPLLAPMAWLLIVLSFLDAAYLWLPNRLVVALAFAGAIAPSPESSPLMRIAGGLIGFAVLWLVAAGFHRLTGRVGLGGGDAKLFGAIGLWCGALELPTVMLLGCAIGLCDGVIRILQGRERAQMRLPLGTYLGISTIGVASFDIGINLQLHSILAVLVPT